MLSGVPVNPSPAQPPLRAPEGGYAKGEQTRARLLAAALDCFGPDGFEKVTTRQIATRAGVNLTALTYYFGSKEGLYLACAQYIAGQYSEALNPAAVEADRKSVVEGKRVSGRVELGGRMIIKKKKLTTAI